jgi:hypothetical protein
MVMLQDTQDDVTSLRIRLNELRSQFDMVMRDGGTFDIVKAIYLRIKEIECYLRALQWNPNEGAFIKHEESHRLA